jgi:hypothetical protein
MIKIFLLSEQPKEKFIKGVLIMGFGFGPSPGSGPAKEKGGAAPGFKTPPYNGPGNGPGYGPGYGPGCGPGYGPGCGPFGPGPMKKPQGPNTGK